MAEPRAAPSHRTRTDVVVLVAVGLAGLALVAAGGIARWIGVALWLALLAELWSFERVRAIGQRLARYAPYLLVGALFVGLFGDLLLGDPPASRDHGIHYFQTHLLAHELLPSGRLWGWSESFNNGYPFGENYPTLGYLLTSAAHLASLETLSLRVSYAWGLAAVWAIGAVGVWWLAALLSREAGHQRAGAWAGAIAAALWLLDAGASRQGGWNYAMFHGVWPQQLSAALWVLSLPLTWRAFEAPTGRRIAGAGLALGASVLAHPFGLLAAATSGGGWLVALLLRRRDDRPLPGPLRVWGAVHLVALASCAWWLAVFFGSAEAMQRSPVPWRPLGRITIGALSGELFDTQWAWLAPLFLLGAIAIVRRGSSLGLQSLGLVLALLLLAANEALTVLRLDLLVSGFKNLQFPRYAIELKPVMFAIAGFGAIGIPAAIRGLGASGRHGRGRTWALALVLAPFATAGVQSVQRIATRPVGAVDVLRGPDADADAELLAALLQEKATTPGMRVAFARTKMSSATFALFAITDADLDLVVDGHVPAVNFRHQVRRRVGGYRRMGVTHFVYDRDLAETEVEFAEAIEEVGEYGRFRLARFSGATREEAWLVPDAGVVQSETVGGAGLDVTVEELERKAKLTLIRAPHVRWQATWRGEAIEPDEAHAQSGVTPIEFTIDGPGKLELRYSVSGIERFAGWMSLTAWFAGLFGLGSRREIRFRRRVLPRSAGVIVIVAVTLGVVLAARRQANKLETTWIEAASDIAYQRFDDDPTFVTDLVEAGGVAVEVDPPPQCGGLATRDVKAGCSEVDLRPHLHTLYRAPYLYRCVDFTLPPHSTATVTLGSGGHDLVGTLLRRETGTKGKKLEFGITFDPQPFKRTKRDFHVAARHNADGATATIINGSRDPERFCISAAEVDPPGQ